MFFLEFTMLLCFLFHFHSAFWFYFLHCPNFKKFPVETMLEKMVKKGNKNAKATVSEDLDMVPLFSDTTWNKDGGTTSWEATYNLLDEENTRVLETKATTDVEDSSEDFYFEAACSFLHKIVVRPKLLPYMDMVRWIIDNVDILDRTLRNFRHEFMGSFTPDNLCRMYHLLEPHKLYDKAFIKNFSKENEDPMDVM